MQYNKTVLQQALERVLKAVPTKPTLPALKAIKMAVGVGTTTLSATDFDVFISTTVESDTNSEHTMFVPGRIFSTIVGSLSPRFPVELRTNEQTLFIKSGRSNFEIPLMSGEDYPDVEPLKTRIGGVPATTFRSLIDNVKPFIDTSLPVLALQGVHLKSEGGELTVEGTDRFTVSKETEHWGGSDFDVVVPANGVFAAVSNATIGDLEIFHDDGRFGWFDGHTHFSARLLDADYVVLDKIVEHRGGYNHLLVFKNDDLKTAIKQLRTTSETKVPRIVFTVNNNEVTLHSSSNDGSSTVQVDAEVFGGSSQFVVDPTHIDKVLSTTAGLIGFAYDEPNRPIWMYQSPDFEATQADVHIYPQARQILVMPVRAA